MQTIHFTITLNLNEDSSWRWNKPQAEEQLSFSVPVDMFDEKRLSALLAKAVDTMQKRYPSVVAQYEAEVAAEAAEKEKAKAEAEA